MEKRYEYKIDIINETYNGIYDEDYYNKYLDNKKIDILDAVKFATFIDNKIIKKYSKEHEFDNFIKDFCTIDKLQS